MSSRFHPPSDLTRWNRAGLKRLRYVDGDAATWLEELRLGHMVGFLRHAPESLPRDPDVWRTLFARELPPAEREHLSAAARSALVWRDLWRAFPDSPEDATARNSRLLRDYHAPLADHTLEIARAFARALHVLLGHADAYANEGYLRTATQWDNVRKLVTTVGYEPGPPASASTRVALTAKEGSGLALVKRGLAARHAPAGGAPLLFESLTDVLVHPALNAVRPAGWNRDDTGRSIGELQWPVPEEGRPGPGTVMLLVTKKKYGCIVQPCTESETDDHFTIACDSDSDKEAPPADTVLYLNPAPPRRPLLGQADKGQLLLRLGAPHAALLPGAVVLLLAAGERHYAQVEAVQEARVLLARLTPESVDEVPCTTEKDSDTQDQTCTPAGAVRLIPLVEAPIEDSQVIAPKGLYSGVVLEKCDGLESCNVDNSTESIATSEALAAYFVPAVLPSGIAAEVKECGEASRAVEFPGAPPGGLKSGAWMAARDEQGEWQALKVREVRVEEKTHTVTFELIEPEPTCKLSEQESTWPDHTWLVYGPFKTRLRPRHHDRARCNAFTDQRTLKLDLDPTRDADALGLLKRGRVVIIESEEAGGPGPVRLTIDRLTIGDGGPVISVREREPDLSRFKAGWTVLRGNTVPMGHGESRGTRVLGSGNGERPRQSFIFDVADISHITDPVAGTGVAPDLEVTVDGTTWARADTLDTLAEGRDAYSPVLREDGTLRIDFRRRLPTGRDNIVVQRYRVGTGARGNGVPPFSLTAPNSPHPVVTAIRQPFTTTGGGDGESAASMRTNAPRHLRALDRAVSLNDFGILARRLPGIAQARAAVRPVPGRRDEVVVTVVPIGGGPLDSGDAIAEILTAKAPPGVHVRVEVYTPILIDIAAVVRVDGERFIPEEVRAAAEAALLAHFAIDARALGQTLYSSEILAVLERVKGVENATATLFLPNQGSDTGGLRTLPAEAAETPMRAIIPAPNQLIYLHASTEPGAGGVTVSYEEIGS